MYVSRVSDVLVIAVLVLLGIGAVASTGAELAGLVAVRPPP